MPLTGAKKCNDCASEAHLEVKALAMDAMQALLQVDADSLEALERRCEELTGRGDDVDAERAMDRKDLATFARVLEASRANLNVLRQLGARRMARLDYSASSSVWPETGSGEH